MTHDSESFSHSTLAGLARILAAQAPVSLMIATLVLLCLGYPTRSAAQSTIACPTGTYDMLDWMTLDSSLRSTYHLEGTSNPLYTVMQPGKFYWVKGGGGYPWDIQLYDSAIRNSPTTRICHWFRGAQSPGHQGPRSKLRTLIMICTPTARRPVQ